MSFPHLPAGNHKLSTTVDGLLRRYIVHVPHGCNRSKSLPLVIMFHGGGGSARAAMWQTGWDRKADTECFLAVFPEGTAPNPALPARFRDNPQTWNDGSNRSSVGAVRRDVADVAFVSRMIDELKSRLNVDERRIFATGFSNGAGMTFRLARELSTVFTAIAPVAGTDWMNNKRPSQPVPLLYIVGAADPLNPMEGGEIHLGRQSFGTKPPIRKMIATWVKLHNCRTTPRIVYEKDGDSGLAYGKSGVDAVVIYTLNGHGHHWPGGRSLLPKEWAGANVAKFPATDVIWEFFKRTTVKKDDSSKP